MRQTNKFGSERITRRSLRWCAVASLCQLVILAGHAAAEQPCTTCGDTPFPNASAFLASQGFPADQYSVLTTWNEVARKDRTKVVYGYHVKPADGSAAFDLYSDISGNLIGTDSLAALGIKPKNWNLRPRAALPEAPQAQPASAKTQSPTPSGVSRSVAPSAKLELPAIDLAAVQQEDETATSLTTKGVVRIGVFQELPQPLSISGDSATSGAWTTLPDGSRLWAATVHSPDAKGIRVHFPEFRLPSGAQVLVYNAHDPSECYGPYTAPYPGEHEIWAATCFSDEVVVECTAPASAAPSDISFRVDKAIHIYRGFDSLQWGKAGVPAKSSAGSCNLDVTCYSDWASTARGVGGLGIVNFAGYLWCTGSLIVDTDPTTSVPYFLTAHHCVGGQDGSRGASSIEVYWLYQTPTCNGTPPQPTAVPRTVGGADYLAGAETWTATGNDFSLLRLRNTPQSGITYLGWSTAAPPIGTPVTCIHHPNGDYKRIAFANLVNVLGGYPDMYHEVRYTAGTTEHGSSGCPLMRSDTGQIIGQLYGGTASCSYPNDSDFYGRFDVTFPLVQSYLDPEGDPPLVDFAAATYDAEEGNTATVTVKLTVVPGSPVQVDYSTADGTALAGTDYTATSGTLVFEGTTDTRTFTVNILDNTHTEANRAFLVTLGNPVGCVLAAVKSPATVTIQDNDPDSDGDGISDYDETHGVYGYVTDPNNPDTDGDGISDYVEEMGSHGLHTDPTEYTTLSALSVPFFREVPAR